MARRIPTLTTEMYKALRADPRFNVIGIQGSIMRSFMFHNEYEPAQDFRVRQAFLHALDRRALIDAFWQGNGTPINTPFQNPNWCDCAEWDQRYEFNPDKAREMLAAAGWDSDEVIENKTYYVDREDFFRCYPADAGAMSASRWRRLCSRAPPGLRTTTTRASSSSYSRASELLPTQAAGWTPRCPLRLRMADGTATQSWKS